VEPPKETAYKISIGSETFQVPGAILPQLRPLVAQLKQVLGTQATGGELAFRAKDIGSSVKVFSKTQHQEHENPEAHRIMSEIRALVLDQQVEPASPSHQRRASDDAQQMSSRRLEHPLPSQIQQELTEAKERGNQLQLQNTTLLDKLHMTSQKLEEVERGRDDLQSRLREKEQALTQADKAFKDEVKRRDEIEKELAEALSALARRNRHTRVRILIADSRDIVSRGHRLLQLARRLPSAMHMQKIPEHPDWKGETVVIRDRDGVLFKPAGSGDDGFYEPRSRASTQRHLELFDELWRYSEEDPELRSLRL